MKNLRYLRLSYNRFNALPPEMSELKNLTHVFLQGNRLSGDDRHIVVHNVQDEGYQFISDCGAPSDAAEPFVCANCDMCCNALGEYDTKCCRLPKLLGELTDLRVRTPCFFTPGRPVSNISSLAIIMAKMPPFFSISYM